MASLSAIGVLTSGGDAQGMNAALRAVVRTALNRGIAVYAIYEGYQGMVEGGDRIRQLTWNDVGGIMQRGGTLIGTARSAAFRSREGRRTAALHLVQRGIGGLVVIGGDGSLTGANIFRQEWAELLAELQEAGAIDATTAARHAHLAIVGMVGSIDNDMAGTDMTIGADSALHRITEAIDALRSTAASHQRAFVIEVMGRNCGYLALMGAIAGGADWVFIPENPPEAGWEERMSEALRAGRASGRRESLVVIAEGARDRAGNPISSALVRSVLEHRLGEDTRVTILGHVQRGGTPSAFDRWMSTLLGYTAVEELLAATPENEPQLIGMRYNRITRQPLMRCVQQTHAVAQRIAEQQYEQAMALRGGSFTEMFSTFKTLAHELIVSQHTSTRPRRLAVLHAGEPAPGMNVAVSAAVRLGIRRGYQMLGIRDGFEGLVHGRISLLSWANVEGWENAGGAELGTSITVPSDTALPDIARTLQSEHIEGLLIVGGWSGYAAAYALHKQRAKYPAFDIPIICLPAAIENNLPGSELSIGADTALNSIVHAIDQIKQSAVAATRCFIVEVMGGYCGYLALMSGLAGGAERVYLPEDGMTLKDMLHDIQALNSGFRQGKRLGLLVRNDHVHPVYTLNFMCTLYDSEGGGLFETRPAMLGHLQQGGVPTPFDRIQATRLAARSIKYLDEQVQLGSRDGVFIGFQAGQVALFPLERMPELSDPQHQRPREQWWLALRAIERDLAQLHQ